MPNTDYADRGEIHHDVDEIIVCIHAECSCQGDEHEGVAV